MYSFKDFNKFAKQNWIIILAILIFLVSGFKLAFDRYLLPHFSAAKNITTTAQNQIALANAIYQYCQDPTNIQKDLGAESCYAKQFQEQAKQQGPEQAFAILNQLQTIDPTAVGCHLIGHGIGWGTYERNPQDWQNEVQTINRECNYGAIHGILEAYLADQPDHTLTEQVLPQFCGPTPRADCNHIIGHLTLVETRGNIPQALDLCDAFKGQPTQLDFCDTGVFMEEETALNLVEHGFADKSWLDWPARLPTLTKMCLTYTGEAGQACWTELVHVIAVAYNDNPQEVFDYCSKNPVAAAAARCKRHGIGIMASSTNFDIASMKSMCDLTQVGDPNFKSDCYVQLAGSDLSTLPADKPKVQAFCESLDAQYQQACLNQVTYDNYVPDSSTD